MRATRTASLQRPSDHQALDLVRALVDLRDLGVAHVALHRVLADVAVAAEHLHGLDRHGHRGVGGKQLGHGGVLAAIGLVAVDLRARLVERSRAAAVRVSMSASLNWMAWNSLMGCPNWRRSRA